MNKRTRVFLLAMALPAVLAVTACGDDDDDIAGGGGDGQVQGRIENTSTSQPSVAFAQGAGALKPSSASFAPPSGAAGAAEVAVVGEFNSSGTLVVVSDTAQIEAGAPFTVDAVATGRTRMVLEVRDAADVAVGRSIIHGAVAADATKQATPIDGESTAEANVFAELRVEGQATSEIATTEISSWVDFESETEAVSTAASELAIARTAAAFEAGSEAYTESSTQSGSTLSASARFEAGVDAAELFAQSLFLEVDEDQAYRAYADALVEAYAEAGLSAEAQAEAGSSASVAAFEQAADASRTAALAVVRGSVRQMAAARTELAVNALTELGALSAHIESVQTARAQFDAAADNAANEEDITDAASAYQSTLLPVVEDVATTQVGVSASTWADVEDQFASGGFRAELDVLLDTGLAVSTIVDAYSAFYAGLSQSIVSVLTAAGHTEAEASAIADVFVAAESGLAAGLTGVVIL